MKKKLQLKRTLATFAALLCLMSMMPSTAWAETINTVITSEELTRTSTVYVGEVVVDGVSEIKYLYSSDITPSDAVLLNLLDVLNGMTDSDYAAMLQANWHDIYSSQFFSQIFGLSLCSNSELISAMDENWSNATYVGALYFPDKSVKSEINSNLYDIDEGFKAEVDADNAKRNADIDNPIDIEKCIVFHIDGGHSTNNVWYEVVEGEIVKHVDTYVVYSAEATTVIYTKVELASGSTSPVLGDVNGDGDISVNDVAMIVNHILGVNDDNFIIANADINGDGEIDINDVMGTVSIILGGSNNENPDTPEYSLSCPDDHHPHMIDLGLPSGTKWACCNVGADKPEDWGGHYAWGETEEKSDYRVATYWHVQPSDFGNWYDDGTYFIFIDLGPDIAGTQYDVAHVKWGSSWVMPSMNQIYELLNYCSNKIVITKNREHASILTGPNGNSIYFPSPGLRSNTDNVNWGSLGRYWSSNEYLRDGIDGIDYAYCFNFHDGWPDDIVIPEDLGLWHRFHGCSVRPVSR